MTLQSVLVFSIHPPRYATKDHQKKYGRAFLILLMGMFLPLTVNANVTCKGRFVNPITDICWSCLMPISIGGMNIGKGVAPKKRDTKNPSFPLCMCNRGNPSLPVPGVSIGFWEPVRLVDVTRTPYCMTNLGGISVGSDPKRISSYDRRHSPASRRDKSSFYHVHYYVYPVIYWLELLTDFTCLEQQSFDVAYMSEFDISWNDSKMQSLLNPEAILFGNPIAQSSCAIDCTASTTDMPRDEMFWCAGCLGNMYPLSGANADHVGGVQNSSLLTMRILNKMHRLGLAQETSTSDGSINGQLCRKSKILKLKKTQYKMQMVYPKATSGDIGCWPLGLSDMLYSSFKEFPYEGEDWGYLIWRKKNCCLL